MIERHGWLRGWHDRNERMVEGLPRVGAGREVGGRP